MVQGTAAGVPVTLAATALVLDMLGNPLLTLASAVALGPGRFSGGAAVRSRAIALGPSLAPSVALAPR